MATPFFCKSWILVLAFAWLFSGTAVKFASAQDTTYPPSFCQALDPSPFLEPFVDELTQPPVVDIAKDTQVTIGAYKVQRKMHRDLPATTLYAYGIDKKTASVPGPTLVAQRKIKAAVRWENHIMDQTPFLTVDDTLMWAKPVRGGVPIVTHLHGGEVDSESDGHPDGWYTAQGDYGPSYTSNIYTYTNDRPAALLWYHDHAFGITRISVLSGLNGAYLLESPAEEPPDLPFGAFERILVLQDKQFREDGSINFPTVGDSPSVHPHWCPEYYGDTLLVNGKAWPFLNVYPTLYRFRMLNACNARFFTLTLSDPSLAFIQIGTDGGLLDWPRWLQNMTIAPAERTDFLLDFTNVRPGESIIVQNSAEVPYPDGDPTFTPPRARQVMKFVVTEPSKNMTLAPSKIPTYCGPTPNINTEGAKVRRMVLTEDDDADGNPIHSNMNNASWTDPVTEIAELNSTEVWEIINLTDDAHPIHIHLINFLVTGQQTINKCAYQAGNCTIDTDYPDPTSCYIEPKQEPLSFQIGWKDTATVFPGKVTTFVMRFTNRDGEPFQFDATTGPGFVWHCHVLDHEDNDMMRPLKVVKANAD